MERNHRASQWKALGIAIAIVVGAAASSFGQDSDQTVHGTRLTAEFILQFEQLDEAELLELDRRVYNGLLEQWECQQLVKRAVQVLRSDAPPTQMQWAMRMLTRMQNGASSGSERLPWGSWVAPTEIDLDGVLGAFVELCDHENRDVRIQAVRSIGQLTHHATRAAPVLMDLLLDPDGEVRQQATFSLGLLSHSSGHFARFPDSECGVSSFRSGRDGPSSLSAERQQFFERMGLCGLDLTCARPLLLDGLNSGDACLRSSSVWMLGLHFGTDEQVRAAIAEAYGDEDEGVRRAVVAAIPCLGLDKRFAEVLRTALTTESFNVRWVAVATTKSLGAQGLPFRELVRQNMLEPEQNMVGLAALTYVEMGGDPDDAAIAVLDSLPNARFGGSTELDYLTRILSSEPRDGVGVSLSPPVADRVTEALESLRDSPDWDLRTGAAWARAMLGGDCDDASREIIQGVKADSRMSQSRLHWLAKSGHLSLEVCREYLASEDPVDQCIAIRALQDSGAEAKPLLPELRLLRESEEVKVAQRAAWAVSFIEACIEYEYKERQKR